MVRKKRKVASSIEECISRYLKFLCPACFNAFYEDIEKEISDEIRLFKEDVKKEIEALDNTPLTRKEYEKKLEQAKTRTNIFVEHRKMEYEEHLSILMKYFISYKLKRYDAKITDEKIDAIFDFVWNNLDFYALLEYFNDEKYKDELMEEEMYRERDNKNNIGRRSYGRTDYPSFMLNMWLKTLIKLDVDEIRDIEFS